MRHRLAPVAIAAFGGLFAGLGIWAAVGSGSFTRALADFGPQNDHLVHDFGAASIAIGAGLLLAVRRTSWRTPVLVVATAWNGLHAVSHLVDLSEARSRSLAVGVGEAVLLVVGTGVLGFLTFASREDA
ncbi:hypothetical protein EV649_2272 [Kribbella sp. VKM Ac-2569]|uniref:hypothetical protein n=1 Tax=Kribbella sp. VKM Ac-2569 TaxID=2512220 RepID=UPI00102C5505|nr:hypothetical protein [Kribbella sp. VKM Ac-2569]RZT28495.1 hypothetical protein EV649_2272 [Kribbella sp. VKM Ac-2569]